MFCPECQSEFREGFTRCSDCDVDLVSEPGAPAPAEQHLGNLMPLAEEQSPELVAEVLDRLEKAEVPYVIEAGTALAMLGNDEIVLEKPDPWEARVWVPEAFREQATSILSDVDEQYGRRRIGLRQPQRPL